MQGSVIISFLVGMFIKLRTYYANSKLAVLIDNIWQFFSRAAQGSILIQSFLKDWKVDIAWKNSIAYKIVVFPIKFMKSISYRLGSAIESVCRGSVILNNLWTLLESLLTASTKIFGIMLLTFTFVEGFLWVVLKPNNLKGIVLRLLLLALAGGLIVLNRSLIALYRGSEILQLIGNIFINPQENLDDSYKQLSTTAKESKQLKITAGVLGVILGILGYVLPFTLFAKVIGGLVVVTAILWKTEIGAFLVVALVPFYPGTMPFVGLVLLCVVSIVLKLLTNRKFRLKYSSLDLFMLFFMGMVVYGSLTSFAYASSIKIALVYITFMLFYIVLISTIKTKRQLYALVVLAVIAAFLVASFGVYQYFFESNTVESWIDEEMFEDVKIRVYSTWENPNVLGEYLVLLIPISFGLMWASKKWFHRLIFGGMTAVMLIGIVLTLSRGSWLGLMLAMGLFALLRDRRLVGLGGLGVLALPFVLPTSILYRFTSIGNLQDTSTNYRVSIWQGSLKIIRDYWPSGIGLGSEAFGRIYPKYALAGAAYALHAHNLYLQILVEVGVIGFISFILLLFMFYKYVLSSYWKTKDYTLSTLMLAACTGMAGYLLNGLFDNIWYNYRLILVFWTIIALGMIGVRLVKNEQRLSQHKENGGI